MCKLLILKHSWWEADGQDGRPNRCEENHYYLLESETEQDYYTWVPNGGPKSPIDDDTGCVGCENAYDLMQFWDGYSAYKVATQEPESQTTAPPSNPQTTPAPTAPQTTRVVTQQTTQSVSKTETVTETFQTTTNTNSKNTNTAGSSDITLGSITATSDGSYESTDAKLTKRDTTSSSDDGIELIWILINVVVLLVIIGIVGSYYYYKTKQNAEKRERQTSNILQVSMGVLGGNSNQTPGNVTAAPETPSTDGVVTTSNVGTNGYVSAPKRPPVPRRPVPPPRTERKVPPPVPAHLLRNNTNQGLPNPTNYQQSPWKSHVRPKPSTVGLKTSDARSTNGLPKVPRPASASKVGSLVSKFEGSNVMK